MREIPAFCAEFPCRTMIATRERLDIVERQNKCCTPSKPVLTLRTGLGDRARLNRRHKNATTDDLKIILQPTNRPIGGMPCEISSDFSVFRLGCYRTTTDKSSERPFRTFLKIILQPANGPIGDFGSDFGDKPVFMTSKSFCNQPMGAHAPFLSQFLGRK